MIINKWIEENYTNILQWAKNAAQKWDDNEDLAHYAISVFLEHEKAEELILKGHARFFIVRILLNSSRGKKSHYYRMYRQNWNELGDTGSLTNEEYDNDIDKITEVIHGILEDLSLGDANEWYMATITQLCLNQDKLNFSKLSRETSIPRTSIANTYYETINYIKNKLNEYGNLDENLRNSLISYLSNAN